MEDKILRIAEIVLCALFVLFTLFVVYSIGEYIEVWRAMSVKTAIEHIESGGSK